MEEVLAKQKQVIEKAEQERQQLLAQIEAESTPAESAAPPTPPPSQPPQDELTGGQEATSRI